MTDDIKILAVKVAGDWELDVLAIPFDTVDSDRQYFDANTEIMAESFKTPLIAYYHGINPNGEEMQAAPEAIGKALNVEKRADGWHVRVLLDKTKEFAKRIWEAARNGIAAASSGSIAHLARLEVNGKLMPYDKNRPGRIAVWPFAELSLIDIGEGRAPANPYALALPVMKSRYQQAGINPPDIADEPEPEAAVSGGEEKPEPIKTTNLENTKMEQKEVTELIAAALKAEREQAESDAAAKKAEQERIDAEVAKRIESYKAEAAKSRRLPETAPYAAKFGELWKYDNIEGADIALGIDILNSNSDRKAAPASKAMYQALAVRALEGKDESSAYTRQALKAAGFAGKSDEVMQQDLTSYGDEWVGVGYGTQLWQQIRTDPNPVLNKMPMVEIPQGFETFYDPTEGADPTWYKVAEVTDENSTTKVPNATVPSSKVGTGRVNETLAKAGARVMWSGELSEDSLIPMLPEIRRKLVVSGQEMLAHVIIDGDTDGSATTNINDIGGTPTGTEPFMLVNGLRKLALITNSANSRNASGTFSTSDFIATAKLLGLGGKDAIQKDRVSFLIDLATHWAALQLDEVKTKDVFSQPTIEGGDLTGIYGYQVIPTQFMHFANQDATYGLKANSAGKVNLDTASANLYGAIVAVRWDQWKFGWKRRMTIETERIARADAYEIVALMRFGLKYRSTEASAITYGVGV